MFPHAFQTYLVVKAPDIPKQSKFDKMLIFIFKLTQISHHKILLIQKVSTHDLDLTSATPRSDILSVPAVVSKRLLGLISLCMIPWLWRYSNPFSNWQKYLQSERNERRKKYLLLIISNKIQVGMVNTFAYIIQSSLSFYMLAPH